MGKLVNIISAIFKKIQGAPGKSFTCNVEGEGDKTYEPELYSTFGVLSRPIKDTKGVVIDLGGTKIITATHNYKLERDMETGETVIYSLNDDGEIESEIYLKKDKTIEIKGEIVFLPGNDNAMRFTPMQIAFNQLKTELNAAIVIINARVAFYAAHTHQIIAPLPNTPTSPPSNVFPPAIPATADMSAAKVEEIKVP